MAMMMITILFMVDAEDGNDADDDNDSLPREIVLSIPSFSFRTHHHSIMITSYVHACLYPQTLNAYTKDSPSERTRHHGLNGVGCCICSL